MIIIPTCLVPDTLTNPQTYTMEWSSVWLSFGMNPQAAVEAARFSSSSFPGSFYPHAYAPGQLNVESGIPTPVRDALALKGHRLHPVPNAGIGAIVTRLDAAMGTRSAGADPRRPTYAFGW